MTPGTAIRIVSPLPRAFLNRASFSGGSANVTVSGDMADDVDHASLSGFDPNAMWIDRFEIVFNSNQLLVPAVEVRFRPRIESAALAVPPCDDEEGDCTAEAPKEDDTIPELALQLGFLDALDPASTPSVVCCRSRYGPCSAVGVEDCFFPGVPGDVSDLSLLTARTLLGLRDVLPLLPPTFGLDLEEEIGGGTLEEIELTFQGDGIDFFPQGSDVSAGFLAMDWPADFFLMKIVDLPVGLSGCGATTSEPGSGAYANLVLTAGGGDFRLRAEGPPAMEARTLPGGEVSTRFGQATLGGPVGRGLVGPGNLSLTISAASKDGNGPNDPCKAILRSTVPSRLSHVLGEPEGELAKALNDFAVKLNDLVAAPAIDSNLTDPAAKRGVVLQLDESGTLQVVFEP